MWYIYGYFRLNLLILEDFIDFLIQIAVYYFFRILLWSWLAHLFHRVVYLIYLELHKVYYLIILALYLLYCSFSVSQWLLLSVLMALRSVWTRIGEQSPESKCFRSGLARFELSCFLLSRRPLFYFYFTFMFELICIFHSFFSSIVNLRYLCHLGLVWDIPRGPEFTYLESQDWDGLHSRHLLYCVLFANKLVI